MITIIINIVEVYLRPKKLDLLPFLSINYFAFCLKPNRVECGLGKDIRLIGVHLIEVQMLQLGLTRIQKMF